MKKRIISNPNMGPLESVRTKAVKLMAAKKKSIGLRRSNQKNNETKQEIPQIMAK
ncbi:hypothetical protein [Costertonia aggregata]|uniref:hypothetical protein n=1 Tax=Costertonia aggregata TaxID=343403 RepID=UPI001D14B6D6|nr:hypothetical protein [Costertonia aggregata]